MYSTTLDTIENGIYTSKLLGLSRSVNGKTNYTIWRRDSDTYTARSAFSVFATALRLCRTPMTKYDFKDQYEKYFTTYVLLKGQINLKEELH